MEWYGRSSSTLKNDAQTVSLAYENEKKQPTFFRGNAWKIWLVCGDCFLIGLAPVLVYMAKGDDGKFSFSPVVVNFMVELVKTVFALGTLVFYGSGRPGPALYQSFSAFAQDARSNRLLAVPALFYAMNNYLKFIMQLYFKPTTAKMLSNLKIIVIALLMRSIMRRSFSVHQWEALYLLVAGITINQLNYCNVDSTGNTSQLGLAAILYTAGSIVIPSLASVYNEFALKRQMSTSVLLQNFFLYFYGACFNLLGLIFAISVGSIPSGGIMRGFSGIAWLLVVNNAMQGILSSFFFKFADTILKKYSSTIATIFTGLMSAALFGHALTLNFALGVSIVFISMHMFFSMGGMKSNYTNQSKKTSTEPQMTFSPSLDHLNVIRAGSVGEFLDRTAIDSEMGTSFQNGERVSMLPR